MSDNPVTKALSEHRKALLISAGIVTVISSSILLRKWYRNERRPRSRSHVFMHVDLDAAGGNEQLVRRTSLNLEGNEVRLSINENELALEVIDFWFVGKMEDNFRNKWFPSGTYQKQMDEEIEGKYGQLLVQAERGDLNKSWTQGPLSFLALILVLDQFSRHIHRQRPVDEQEGKSATHTDASAHATQMKANDIVTVKLVRRFIARGWMRQLTIPQRVFLLMPLRHSRTVENVRAVMGYIEGMEAAHISDDKLLGKFRKATMNSLRHLEMKANSVLAHETGDILERVAFVADESNLHKEKLVLAMEAFLNQYHEESAIEETDNHGMFVCVSLSGGVDSMVIAKILAYLKPKYQMQVVALHINYGNRLEADAEAAYIQEWCKSLDIIFEQRVISELRRGVTARDDYEQLTREIRYGFYEEAQRAYGFGGVIFGHHRGDVQENVISNFFKGNSLLGLNGMSPTSIINGVPIWRPLLHFNKDKIYDFSHTYGVPYFKDTTPSWAVRGKLRNHLVPLLQDMYGDAVLNNLSRLGAESNEITQVIEQQYLIPFYHSAKHSKLCFWIDMKPWLQLPRFIWLEGLKMLFHSLSISMIKEKAVDILLQRCDPQFGKYGRDRRARKLENKTDGHILEPGSPVPVSEAKSASKSTRVTDSEVQPLLRVPPQDAWVQLKPAYPTMLKDGHLIVFMSNVFPKESYFKLGTEISVDGLDPEVATLDDTVIVSHSFGPWHVDLSLEEFDIKLVKRPLSVWDIVSGMYEYYVPFVPPFTLHKPTRNPVWSSVDRKIIDILPCVGNTVPFRSIDLKNTQHKVCLRVNVCFSVERMEETMNESTITAADAAATN